MTFRVGQRAYWWNSLSCENRPVIIVKVLKNRIVVRTDDGSVYSPSPSMVSHKPISL